MLVIARDKEKAELERAYSTDQSELVAVHGRRRVGKTYLVRNTLRDKDCVYFELTGQKQENGDIAPASHQLGNFQYAWKKAFGQSIAKPRTWDAAFALLKEHVDELCASGRRVVLFFDELPWLCSPNSRFFENLDQAWNACFEPAERAKVILCGSASTWMLKKVMHAKAGLSRRVTVRIRLDPFTLKETAQYLAYKGFDLPHESIAELYMIFGGIPYYLNCLSPQKSIYRNIEDECFSRSGRLRDEYDTVFDSLFTNADHYRRVVDILSSRRMGMDLTQISRQYDPGTKTPGGALHQILTNLHECGFISKRAPLFNERKGAIYAVSDEFVLFHHKWIKTAPEFPAQDGAYWQSVVGNQAYSSWMGFSFEMLCLKHQSQIRRALGLHAISAIPGIFYAYDDKGKRCAQVDLLFDRADKTITLCEIKYNQDETELSAPDVEAIRNRKVYLRAYLKTKRKTRRNLLVAYITIHGVKRNRYFNELQPEVVTLNDLFADA